MANKCPMCRTERTYVETSIIKGLDDFFSAVSAILSPDEHQLRGEARLIDRNADQEASGSHAY